MTASSKEAIADRLAEARRRTYELIGSLDDERLNHVYSPILSPLAWDLGHIANFEELWLVQTIGEREPLHGELGRFYDAIENPRRSRGELPILRDAELRSYLADVRERTLEVLDEVDIGPGVEDPLLREGFVYEMLLAHELQHNETMLQLLQMVDGYELPTSLHPPADVSEFLHPYGGKSSDTPPLGSRLGLETIEIAEGEYEIGALPTGFAYDNERPRHTVELAPFEIDRTPVTNGAYIAYMEETGAKPPLYWEGDAESGWVSAARGSHEPVDSAQPVIHVSWEEADAFARWAGKRLPSEREWEVAHTRLAGVGYAWEWTSSDFLAYPDFEAFPYREYSEVFFGDEHKVLRGGSWATAREVMRPSFRNWDLPQRRQIFSGFRCVRDVAR
ncbi:MAG TPA: SUMF1/EgtB/PvdO family nonheme iron enzyme [Solirubrobacterales bacterium]|nr:SUMF1/EgtB/PvdO family nonheme iron enzyme [Solirubrobacterales bacterium]